MMIWPRAGEKVRVSTVRLLPEFEAILQQHLPLSEGRLRPDVPLADLGLDSLGTVRLVMAIENALHVSIPDDLLIPDTFATTSALWKVISGLLNKASA
jgi:acyl carrier protein